MCDPGRPSKRTLALYCCWAMVLCAAFSVRAQEVIIRLQSERVVNGAQFVDPAGLFTQAMLTPSTPKDDELLSAGQHALLRAEIEDAHGRTLTVLWGKNRQGADALWCFAGKGKFIAPCRVRRVRENTDHQIRYDVDVRYVLGNLSRQRVRMEIPLQLELDPAAQRFAYRCSDLRVGEAKIGGDTYTVGLLRRGAGLTFRKDRTTSVLIRPIGKMRFRLRAGVDSAGRFQPRQAFSADGPFPVGGKAFEVAAVAQDGFKLILRPVSQETFAGVGFTMPDLSFESADGEQISLSKLRGKVVVLIWWNRMCADCLGEFATLNALAEKYEDDDRVVFLGASPEDKEALREFVSDHEFNVRVAQAAQQARDILGDTFPRHLIMNQNGTVVYDECAASASIGSDMKAAIQACGISQ